MTSSRRINTEKPYDSHIHILSPTEWSNLPWYRIYASANWVSIGPGNGLSPVRRQAITWTNADLLSIGLLGTNFSEIRNGNTKIFIHENAFENIVYENGGHFVQGKRVNITEKKQLQ